MNFLFEIFDGVFGSGVKDNASNYDRNYSILLFNDWINEFANEINL